MPDWKKEIEERLKRTGRPPSAGQAVIQEFVQHLEDRYSELIASGLSESAARDEALKEIENLEALPPKLPARKQEHLDDGPAAGGALSGRPFADFVSDFRFGWRVIRRSPLFAVLAVVCLAIGIGANTTVFTIVNTLLLDPTPAANPSSLVVLNGASTSRAKRPGGFPLPLSYANLADYMRQQKSFSGVAAYTWPQILTLARSGGPQRLFGELVTGQYFKTLGIKPALGRFFFPSEDSEPGSAPVAVLSYSAWQARFGGARNVLGRTIELNNIAFTVVGVAPKGFLGLSAVFGPDVWLPATMAESVLPAEFRGALTDRAKPMFNGVARLRSGVSIASAQANLSTVARILAKEYPASDEGHGIHVSPVTDALYLGNGGPNTIKIASVVLLAIVFLVLLIACSNVANLLLARAESRRHEMGLRLAVGASRGRLIRQMLAENSLLSLLSCAGGIGLGYLGCRFVWSFVPTQEAVNMASPHFDGTVLAFAIVLSLITTILFGLAPALRVSRADLVTSLKEGSPATGRGRRALSLTNALLVGQVAFSLICLVVAALFFRSIQRAYTINPGFQTKHLALLMINPTQAGYNHERAKEFYRAARERVQALPGVVTASWASGMPFWNSRSHAVIIQGAALRKKSEALQTVSITVSTGYFRTLGIGLVAGRLFNDSDRAGSLPVAVINQTFAAHHWPGGSALGQRFEFAGDKTWRQVVGVVKNADYTTLGEAPQPCVYLPLRQNFVGGMVLYARSRGNPAALLPAIQRQIREIDSSIEVSDARTGRLLIEQVLWGPKVGVALLGLFGALALILAMVGLYGVMAYAVNRRRREIGVRMALGATRSSVLSLIVADGMKLVGWGIAIGVAVSLLLSHALAHFLFGIGSYDPASFGAACLALILVALAACYVPARAATRIEPMEALREG